MSRKRTTDGTKLRIRYRSTERQLGWLGPSEAGGGGSGGVEEGVWGHIMQSSAAHHKGWNFILNLLRGCSRFWAWKQH
jgi:hypothetical protein